MKILVLGNNANPLTEQLRGLGYTDTISQRSWTNTPSPSLQEVELILIDVADGVDLDLLIHVRHALPSPIILLIGSVDEQVLVDAYRAGIDDHVGKPLSSEMLWAKLQVWQRWIAQLQAVK